MKKIRITPAEIYTQLLQRATMVEEGSDQQAAVFNAIETKDPSRFGALVHQFNTLKAPLRVATPGDRGDAIVVALESGEVVLVMQAFAHNTDLIRVRAGYLGELVVRDDIMNASIDMDANMLERLYQVVLGSDVIPQQAGDRIRRQRAVQIRDIFESKTVGEFTTAQKVVGYGVAVGSAVLLYTALVTTIAVADAILTACLGILGSAAAFILAMWLLCVFWSNIIYIVSAVEAVTDWFLAIFWPSHNQVGGIRRIASGVKTAAIVIAKGVAVATKQVFEGVVGLFKRKPAITVAIA